MNQFIRQTRRAILTGGLLSFTGACQTTGDGSLERRVFRDAEAELYRSLNVRPRSKFIRLADPDVRLRIVEFGSGEPIIWLHGGNGFGAHWAPLASALEGRMIIPDRPGCGLSSAFSYDNVSMRTHASKLVSGIMDAMGIERAIVIGNSLGGYFALCSALDHPNRIVKLILAGGPAGSAPIPRLSADSIEARVRASRRPGPEGLQALVADPRRVPPLLAHLFDLALMLPGTEESWRSILRSLLDAQLTHALLPELPNLLCQTLILWGAQDRIDPPTGRADLISDQMPHAQLAMVNDAGHLPWLDQPAVCGGLIADFLQ